MRELVDRWARSRPLLVLVLMGTYSVQSLLITASKQHGGFTYDATAAVLLAEALKLAFALLMLPPEVRATLEPSKSFVFAVPAVLYAVQNRLVFEALRHITPPEYQLLNNMKLFTTCVVYRVALRRQLKLLQWLALLLLGIGMAVAEMPAALPGTAVEGPEGAAGRQTLAWSGTAIMFLISWCSAGAGVLNEWLIKRSANVLEANVWLYLYGTIACAFQLGEDGWRRFARLEGFTALTWLVVLCNAVLGQTVAFLFRYADSIVKLYAVCAAMVFTTLCSVVLFGFEVHLNMVAGYLSVAISMCLYHMPTEVLLATDAELVSSACAARAGHKQRVE